MKLKPCPFCGEAEDISNRRRVEISGSKKIIDKLDSVLFEGCT